MQQNSFDAIARGVECPKCHTVYFLDRGKNRDRMYHYSGGNGQERWKLLCICNEQFLFEKKEVHQYQVKEGAVRVGWAAKGQWQHSEGCYVELVANQVRRKIEVSRHSV